MQMQIIRIKTYRDFFEFCKKHLNEGAIYDLKDDGKTK